MSGRCECTTRRSQSRSRWHRPYVQRRAARQRRKCRYPIRRSPVCSSDDRRCRGVLDRFDVGHLYDVRTSRANYMMVIGPVIDDRPALADSLDGVGTAKIAKTPPLQDIMP